MVNSMANPVTQQDARILCPNCGTANPVIQQVKKKNNPLLVLLYLVLLFLPVVGWIALFVALTKREKTEPQCTCQSCAHTWLLGKK
jgi:DNA-directed RNA polymerase subunit M/transcription elongation factor TFIIS